jgi:phage gp29-like protein
MSTPTSSPLHDLVRQPIPKRPPKESKQELPRFHFKEITPEDWRANEAPLADLYQRGIVSAEYVRQRLKIPDEAGKGTMAPAPQAAPKPLADVKSEVPEKKRPHLKSP